MREWWALTTLYNQSDGQHASSNLVLKKSVKLTSSKDLVGDYAVQNGAAHAAPFQAPTHDHYLQRSSLESSASAVLKAPSCLPSLHV